MTEQYVDDEDDTNLRAEQSRVYGELNALVSMAHKLRSPYVQRLVDDVRCFVARIRYDQMGIEAPGQLRHLQKLVREAHVTALLYVDGSPSHGTESVPRRRQWTARNDPLDCGRTLPWQVEKIDATAFVITRSGWYTTDQIYELHMRLPSFLSARPPSAAPTRLTTGEGISRESSEWRGEAAGIPVTIATHVDTHNTGVSGYCQVRFAGPKEAAAFATFLETMEGKLTDPGCFASYLEQMGASDLLRSMGVVVGNEPGTVSEHDAAALRRELETTEGMTLQTLARRIQALPRQEHRNSSLIRRWLRFLGGP